MKIAFVTDTGTGRSPDEWKKQGVYCVPLQIECEGVSYDEMVTITYDQYIQNLHDKKLMKTSLPKLGHIEECYQEIKDAGYDAVFCVPICKGLSGALDAFQMMAEQMDLTFYGVDCHTTAVVQARLVEIAKEMIEQGQSMDAVMERMERIIDTADTILIFEDLQHMVRGGRLTPMAAALGGLLKIKPVLHLDRSTQGRVDVLGKVRTMKKAQQLVIDRMIEMGANEEYTYILAHVDALEGAKEYAQRIRDAIPGAQIQIIDLVSTVGVHTGLGCLAIEVFNDRI